MKIIAVIPARGGSKRIPRKNIKPFLGKPIIAYSIQAALDSGLFDEVMVSTDDAEIADVAAKMGAKVPFLRSNEASNDFATIADVLKEVIHEYHSVGQSIDYICLLYPTAPFVQPHWIKQGWDLLKDEQRDAVLYVVPYSYPILRSLKIEDNTLKMIWPENMNVRSQDLEPAYHDSGQLFWINTEAFLKEGTVFMKNTGAVVLKEMEVQDIDTITDWELAEAKFQFLYKK